MELIRKIIFTAMLSAWGYYAFTPLLQLEESRHSMLEVVDPAENEEV